ncbi:hypothetical protein Acj9p007 [Acinetobacter phage Acj9]|uniref:Lipoprotein n=1 Tax=Acinetobacter phage Acj9 TaxID=760939 RepID=E5EPE1_9CAUD|nr:hypothetical protein Acj9p007 [Acinetobacter phage Acj9]ADG59907.1 hypothetical protein Acj9p007 [Acinetobacter phage Acj9]
MNFSKKAAIALLIVPAFVMTGCSAPDDSVATAGSVAQTADGAYVAVADNLNKSYEEAKSNGYTGTYEDWVKLLELHQTNPQQAAQQASSQGFDGMDMLMAGAMGMMLGNMMSNGSYNSYRDRQRSYGSSAYTRPSTSNLTSARQNVAKSQAASRSTSTASRSTSTTSRGGFGGATSSGG